MMTTGNKASDEVLDINLPAPDEFLIALEDYSEAPEIQRPAPIGLTSTSRKLARNWQAILDDSSASQTSNDHYLSESEITLGGSDNDHIEADFVVALTTFLIGRLNDRFQEVRDVQLQLQIELARFSPQ